MFSFFAFPPCCYETPNKPILMAITTVLWFVYISPCQCNLVVPLSAGAWYTSGTMVDINTRHMTAATQTFLNQFLNCRPAALPYFSQSDDISLITKLLLNKHQEASSNTV